MIFFDLKSWPRDIFLLQTTDLVGISGDQVEKSPEIRAEVVKLILNIFPVEQISSYDCI